ncbi:MAG: tetratricopeptide repeat protein [Magnetococcales bacterium]|nr:tetratricopeptide repeat protein [Magnetococcales bacterium]
MALQQKQNSAEINSTAATNKETVDRDQDNSETLIAKAMQYHQNNDLVKAANMYDQALLKDPRNIKLLYLRGMLCLDLEDHQKGVDLLSLAVSLNPTDQMLNESLANAHWANNNLLQALNCFNKILTFNPTSTKTLYNKGCVLLEQEDYENAKTCLEEALKLDSTFYLAYEKLSKTHAKCNERYFEKFYLKLQNHYDPQVVEDDFLTSYDLLFLDAKLALKTAREKNQIKQTIYIKSTQVCYYTGNKISDPPKNLIWVPVQEMFDYFHRTRYRLPSAIEFNPESEEQTLTAKTFTKLLENIYLSKNKVSTEFFYVNKNRKPDFNPEERLRFFLYASRNTVVMQYCSRNIAKALENNGCEVNFLIEESDLEDITTLKLLTTHFEFNPHAVININHIDNQWLHPDVYNIVWWQDYMNGMEEKKENKWRERDIVLTADPALIPYLEMSGAKDIKRQEFCVDTTIFQNTTPISQRRKAVFIGNNYIIRLEKRSGEDIALSMLQDMLDKGEPYTKDYLNFVAKKSGLPIEYIFDLGPLLTHVVRETSVKWLCELAPKLDLEVEIYGRGWDDHPVISPYFKGEVEHGPKVAALYNQAKYALSSSPYVVDSQRLSEIAACGVIPVMYDARPFAQKPHWDDECLWFHSKEEFIDCFNNTTKNDPAIIAQTNSYDAFAKRIIKWIKP